MNSEKNERSFDAIAEAQKIAFGPVVFQAALAMRNLGILQLILKSRKGISTKDIAESLSLSEYGVGVLLEMAESANIVYQFEEDKYKATKVGFFLNGHKMTTVNINFIQDVCYNGLFHMEEAIKEGTPAGLKVFGQWPTIYEGLSQLDPHVQKSWFEFDHFYSDEAFDAALEFVFSHELESIIDIGGNTGKWAIACCKKDPNIKVTILDLPGQLNVALGNIKKEGFESRVSGVEINLLHEHQAIPRGASAIWMSQFLDCFSKEEILNILKGVAKAMDENTRLFIMETFTDRQTVDNANYCLRGTSLYFTVLANGNSKMYKASEFYELIEEAGLKVSNDTDDIGHFHTILTCMKA